MDKIREEFEKWYEVEMMTLQSCILPKDDPIKEFAFILYKSRDEEIKKLNQDCKHFMEMNNNLAGILDSKDEEIKKLRDAISKAMDGFMTDEGFSKAMDLLGVLCGRENNIGEIKVMGYIEALKDGE